MRSGGRGGAGEEEEQGGRFVHVEDVVCMFLLCYDWFGWF